MYIVVKAYIFLTILLKKFVEISIIIQTQANS